MSPKKKLVGPARLPVDAVWWIDAQFKVRHKLDTDQLTNLTVGLVVYEDEKQIILAHEVASAAEYLSDEMDWTQVPKSLIQRRVSLQTIDIVPEENPSETNVPS